MKIPFFPKKTPVIPSNNNTKSFENMLSIYARLIDTYVDFSRKDIQKWRNALESAMDIRRPSNVDLQDIYTDVGMDAHLQAVILIRKSSVLNTAFNIYTPDGGVYETTKSFIERSWTYQLISLLLDSTFFGASVIEIESVSLEQGLCFHHIPARHYNPFKKYILLNPHDAQQRIPIMDYPSSLLPIAMESPLGIVNNVIPQIIWKRHAQQSWAEFSERFGVPIMTATSNQKDKNTLAQLEQKMRDAGESLTAVLPTGTSIDIKQPSNTDAFRVFLERVYLSNDEISKQILGGTMITDNGASHSQSEVHERTLDERIALSDMRMIEFFFNDVLFPILTNDWGMSIPDGCRFAFDNANKLSTPEIISLVQTLSNTHEIDTAWLSKTFNIPLTPKSPLI